MKKNYFSWFFAIAVLFSFSVESAQSQCTGLTAPFTEDFNGGALPTCWTNTSSNTVANGLWKFTGGAGWGAAGNGGKADGTFAWTDGSTPEVADITLISPSIDVSALTLPFLEFEWFSNNEDFPGDNVPLIVEVNDGGGWTTVATLTGDNIAWQNAGIPLNAYVGATIEIRFITDQTATTNSAFYNDILLDNFSLSEAPTCPDPSALGANSITPTSANLFWTDNAGASTWDIEIGTAGFTPTGTPTNAGVTNPFSATGLTSNTSYEYYVRADCGGGDLSGWVGPFEFSTPCTPFTATYTQNFDGGPAVIPFAGIDCWSITGAGQNDIDLVDNTDDGEPIPSAPNAVELNDGNLGTQDSAILVSPVFSDLNTGANRIRIMVHQENPANATADLYVGVMSDPNDPNTFVMYDTITNAEMEAGAGFNEHTVYFNNTTLIGSNDRIAFMHGDDTYEVYIDDFVYEPSPSCIEPTSLLASNVTDSSVDLTWTDINSSTPASWNIEYGPTGYTQGTGTVVNTTNNPETISGLSPSTSYDFYIQSDCGGGDQSAWYGPITVVTPQIPVSTFPYTQDWESGQGNWQFGNGTQTNYWIVGSATNNGGTNSLYITDDGSSYNYDIDNASVVHAYRDFSIPAGNPYIEFSFDWKGEGETVAWDKMRVYIAPTSYTPTTGDEIIASGTAPTGIIQLNGDFNDQIDYITETFVLDQSYDGNTFRIIFEWDNDGLFGTSNPASVDNIMVDIASCGDPSNLSVPNETNTTADVDWDPFGPEPAWNVQYGPTGFALGTGSIWDVSVASDTTLDNLMQFTEYDVYVQAECATNDTSSWIGPVTFTTQPDCPEPIAFQITGSTATSVDLSWNAQGTETSWNVEYGPAGFTPGTGSATVQNVTVTTPTISGLMPGTVYEFYVEADCPTNNPFAGPLTYATPIENDAACDAIAVPVDGSTTTYSNIDATLETGETTTNGDNTVWFTFTAPADGHLDIKTCGNDFDNFIEVYEASDCSDFNTFTLVDEATDNPFATCNGTTDPAGLILCGLTPGNTYHLAVGSETAGNTGVFPLTLTAIPNAEAGTGTTSQVCSGDMVNLSGALSGNNNGGVWSEIDMTGGLEPNGVYNTSNLAYTDFEVEYRVTNECSYDSTIVTVSISGPSQAGNDGTITDCNVEREIVLITALSGTVDFGGTWSDLDGTGQLNNGVFTPDSLAAGTYTFEYIVSNGVCPADTSVVEVNLNDCLGTEDLTAENFKIFPNPTNGIFYIVSTVNANNAVVEITDLQGKVVSSEQMNLNIGSQYDFNLSQLERGVYLIRVATEENTTVKRVVLQR